MIRRQMRWQEHRMAVQEYLRPFGCSVEQLSRSGERYLESMGIGKRFKRISQELTFIVIQEQDTELLRSCVVAQTRR